MSAFKRLVNRLPYSWEKILGMGISFFINEQNPSDVKFNVRVNGDDEVVGWEMKVDTDKDSTKDAKDFWENYVDNRL